VLRTGVRIGMFFVGKSGGVSSIDLGLMFLFDCIKGVISLDIKETFEYFFVFEHSLGIEVFGVFIFDCIEADIVIRRRVVD
jgi:hypothetical protein